MSEKRGQSVVVLDGSYEAGQNTAPRICVIGDREWWNAQAIIDQGNLVRGSLQLSGVIAPGGELDSELPRIIRRFDRHNFHRTMLIPIEEEGGTYGLKVIGPNVDFQFTHAPYDGARLKSEPGYRKAHCEKLVREVQSTGADYIFLSNFKMVLDPVFVEAFEGKVINVHPSVLPLLKGFRPELRVNNGELVEASGYTIHFVDTDLDGGATLFQQKVRPAPYDAEEEARLGVKEYAKRREEQTRLRIIDAERIYSADVLALVASDRKRKIVYGAEAFAAEGRAGFEDSPEYLKQLEEEGDGKPYSRVLFQVGRKWKTAEAILRAEEYAEEKDVDVVTNYSFRMAPGKSVVEQYAALVSIAEKIRAEKGLGTDFKTSMNQLTGEISISMPYVADELVKYAQFAGIECLVESTPTRVTTPRKPIKTRRED